MALLKPHDWLTTKLVTFIAKLTPRCREVTRLLSQGMDCPLPLRTRAALRLHFTVCDYCRRYAKQLKFLREVSRALPRRGVDRSTVTLPEATKARLRQPLQAVADDDQTVLGAPVLISDNTRIQYLAPSPSPCSPAHSPRMSRCPLTVTASAT